MCSWWLLQKKQKQKDVFISLPQDAVFLVKIKAKYSLKKDDSI
jgi:hypothetical protein